MNGQSLVCLVAAGLAATALTPAALGAEPVTIVAFGDSTTAPRTVNGQPLDVYADRLRRELPKVGITPIEVVNAGVSGHSTVDARKRFERDVLERNPDLVVIQFGINDSAVDVWRNPPAEKPRVLLETYEANLRYFVETLGEREIRAVLMTPNPMRWTARLKELYGKPPYDTDDPHGFNVLLADYAQAVRQIARDERLPLVDVFAMFEEYGKADGRSVDELLLDGMHPNAAGHQIIADRLVPEVAALVALRTEIVRPQRAGKIFAPVVVRESPENEANVVSLPDGTLKLFFVEDFQRLASMTSTDGGLTWSEPATEFAFSGRSAHAIRVLLDRQGELHAFFLIFRGDGRKLAVDRFLDIWHIRSQDSRPSWSAPQRVFAGYCGALRGAAELPSGRLVLAFASAVPGRPAAPPTGQSVSTTVFSDDGGQSWQPSEAQLTAPCFPNYNGNNYGAVEPSLLPLKDGRVWMLIRTQTGRMYEAFSKDGAEWSETRPSPFYSSNSPAAQLRLGDGRIVVFWNNCQLPPRVAGQGVYGGRDALHAAISADEGRTWRGMREVYRDPTRNLPPPKRGDRGTAYPNAAETKDGKILLTTGQGAGRRAVLLLDPDWLLETEQSEDFAHGLKGWSTFKSVGPASGYWRNRIPGCTLTNDPTAAGDMKRVLHLRRPAAEPPDGALRNFPVGRKGTVSFDVRLPKGSAGMAVSLADRLIEPTDSAGEKENLFHLAIDGTGQIGASRVFEPDRWHRVALTWDMAAGRCQAAVDDELVHTLAALPAARESLGASYLRLASTASEPDPAGCLVRSVHVRIEPVQGDEDQTAARAATHDGQSGHAAQRWTLQKHPGEATGGAVLDTSAGNQFDAAWASCPSVVFDGRMYRMWYSSLYDATMGRGGIGLATSSDGIRWDRAHGGRPVLEVGLGGALDDGQVLSPEVLFSHGRYSMWYTGMDEEWHASGVCYYRIFLATSSDGVTWSRANGGQPVLDIGHSAAPDAVQAATPSVLRDAQGYRMWYAAWSPTHNHTICTARSSDGIDWKRDNDGEPVWGLSPAIAYGPAVCRADDGYLMFYMALGATRGLYAARSDDGIQWQMLNDGKPGLAPDGSTAFDSGLLGHPFARCTDDRLQVWYTGYRREEGDVRGWKLRIGLAEATLPN